MKIKIKISDDNVADDYVFTIIEVKNRFVQIFLKK